MLSPQRHRDIIVSQRQQHFDGYRNVTALVGGTIYVDPLAEPIRNGVILIEGETIAAVGADVPANANVIDCASLTITAGFWNSHVHFFERKWANAAATPAPELSLQLEQMLTRYGFTSVFDIGSMWANTRMIRDRIESGEVRGPRIHSTGEGLVPVGGNPSDVVLSMMGVMKMPLPEVADVAQATAATKKLLGDGVDGIKVFVSSPTGASIPETAIQAVVAEAHRAALTPTLTLWKYFMRHDRTSTQQQMVNMAVARLRAWLAAGGAVLFGTDLGAVEYDPSEEYALMAEAGMSFRQILASLTTAPAAIFGESKRLGRLTAGFRADIVAFKDDLTAVHYTIRDGRIIYSTL